MGSICFKGRIVNGFYLHQGEDCEWVPSASRGGLRMGSICFKGRIVNGFYLLQGEDCEWVLSASRGGL